MKTTVRILSVIICLLLLTVGISADSSCKVYRRCNNSNMEIALTFDDGPHPYLTPEILEILKEYNVSATFFVVGQNVSAYPDIAKMIVENGHEIGNHTYTHGHIAKMNRNTLTNEVESCEREIYEVFGEYRTKLFRPPEGTVDGDVKAISDEFGYSVILWSIDTRDWAHTPVSDIAHNVLSNVKSGDIILMHDYIGHNSPTPQALRIIIPELLARGYKFVKISELISKDCDQ